MVRGVLRWLLVIVMVALGGGLLLTPATVPNASASSDTGTNSPPNIVLILCDNLGYGDVGCFYAAARQRTPRIDQMAAEGMRFTHCYAAATVCTPSRAALMTGCYPRRIGLDRTPADGQVLRPVSRYGLHPDEITLAELLKQRGYATACIGKWHLGDQPPFLPTRQGFDEYLGIPYSDDMTARASQPTWPPLPLMEGEQVIEAPVDRNTLTRRYTERAVAFMRRHRDEPFFLYLPHAMPGSTPEPFSSAPFRGRTKNGAWGDAVEEIDWSTGQILDALQSLQLDERTLVIWTNDNGAPQPARRGGSNLPLKGDAYSVAEGGVRVPFVARWPGRIPAGTQCDELITLMDLFATFAQMASLPLPADRVLDSRSILPLLLGEPDARSPHEAFYYFHIDQLQAVRSGPWKLYLPLKPNQEPRLFHLLTDPQEDRDVAAAEPEIVAQLMHLVHKARRDLGDKDMAGSRVRPVGTVDAPRPQVMAVDEFEQ